MLEDAVNASALETKLVALKKGELVFDHQEELRGVITAMDARILQTLNQPYRHGGEQHHIPTVATKHLDRGHCAARIVYACTRDDLASLPLSASAHRTVEVDPPGVQPLLKLISLLASEWHNHYSLPLWLLTYCPNSLRYYHYSGLQ